MYAASRMSTLPPTPKYDPNIPIISSAGGTSVAYKDPKSPESIMKKTTLLQAQTNVDTKYDVDLKAVEGYRRFSKRSRSSPILYFFIFLLVISLYLQKKRSGMIFIAFLAAILCLTFALRG